MANKERVKLLVDALRSEDYRQGRNQLRLNDRYCCLGVACDIAAKNGVGHWSGESIIVSDYSDESTVQLPDGVRDWFGFRQADPVIGDDGETAMYFNDQLLAGFDEIADRFERTYLNG